MTRMRISDTLCAAEVQSISRKAVMSHSQRLASIAERDDVSHFDQVVVCTSFDLGRFALDSRWKRDVFLERTQRGKGGE